MAGYLFGLDSSESLEKCIKTGVYSTKISQPKGWSWSRSQEGTFADYCSMKEGDNVYFFINRKIYGIGELKNIGKSCRYLNYPGANRPESMKYMQIKKKILIDDGPASINNRFVCLFEPSPKFFKNGVDMDDVLSSSPSSFKMLRVFWKLSFIKFGDEENQAFKNILLQRNYEMLANNSDLNNFLSEHSFTHRKIKVMISKDNYSLDYSPFLSSANDGDKIKHEMAIEATLINQLSEGNSYALKIFGKWDYLSHQVAASPFKPVDYIDKMDIFGYSYIQGQKPTVGKFLVIELKKDMVTEQDLLQLMKYIDWVKNEYSSGDYSMINAYLVGYEFSKSCLSNKTEIVERNYIYGVRPSSARIWKNVNLIKYSYDQKQNRLCFKIVRT